MAQENIGGISEILEKERHEHLEKLNRLLGYKPKSEASKSGYWIIFHPFSKAIVVDDSCEIKGKDQVLLFDPDSQSCTTVFTVEAITKGSGEISLSIEQPVPFETPVQASTLCLSSSISSHCKKILAGFESKKFGKIDAADYDAIVKIALSPKMVDVQLSDVRGQLDSGFIVSDDLIGQICAALNSGHNVILTGPPGTGKTTLAWAISIAARKVEPFLTTATADWSTFDTVGGYMPAPSSDDTNALLFEAGIIVQSMIDRRWIIVDEINRAPIDKAIGQLFTVLSGGDVLLPFRNRKTGNRLKIVSGNDYSSEDIYSCSEDWRMIATMNEYDKNALFDMSYAFMRRFAIIRVGIPDDYPNLVRKWCEESGAGVDVTENIASIVENHMKHREIGPAIIRSMLAYMKSRGKSGSKTKLYYAEALATFLVPQLQGLEADPVTAIAQPACDFLKDDDDACVHFKKAIWAMTGETL
jgi:MoxR-like ATPase